MYRNTMTHYAMLDWQQNEPLSTTFGDIYFSRRNGLAETHHVFLQHNRLPERFATLPDAGQFTIAELGFGTGLSFLCAWRCFCSHAPASARLHFISIDKYPLSPTDLAQALAHWPELAPESLALQQHYQAITPGWHRFHFAQHRITLTFIVGDVRDVLPKLDATVDAWFLDGFAPAKNPEMWHPSLFNTMATFSYPGTSFATFTSAGIVRRGLMAAGFQVAKAPGWGHKREISYGTLRQSPPLPWQAPWFARPTPPCVKTAIVIGGGLSGASTAWSLACRGWQVTLIERHTTLANEASGNPQGILYTKLSAHNTALTQWVLSGHGYSSRLLSTLLGNDSDQWQSCGIIQLAFDTNERVRQQELIAAGLPDDFVHAVAQEHASQLAGLTLPHAGLYFPQGAWVSPPALVNAMCAHPNIQLRLATPVHQLTWDATHQTWTALGPQGPIVRGATVILATAADTASFADTRHLPLKRIRGQITITRATPASSALKTILCAQGYVLPTRHNQHSIGASFKFTEDDLTVRADEHEENLAMLSKLSPTLYNTLCHDTKSPPTVEGGRAAFRCTSPDYMPLIGPVVRPSDFVSTWHALRHNAALQLTTPAPWVPNLYVNTAHGSRGLVSAPLSGEIIAAYLNNEPAPVSRTLMEAIHPNRFVWRDWVRHKIKDKHL